MFNPDSVVGEVERVFPGKGREFTNIWRTRQFEYTWLRSMTNRYVDFLAVTEDALVYAASARRLEPTEVQNSNCSVPIGISRPGRTRRAPCKDYGNRAFV